LPIALIVGSSLHQVSAHCFYDRTQQLWVAATARDKAVDRVLDAFPKGGPRGF